MTINSMFKERHKTIHLIGIGGIGMSGIAQILLESGFLVSGSDIKDSAVLSLLRDKGAKIFIGHDENNLADADVVVFSAIISLENPEIIAAKKRNIPVITRALMLAELMRLKCGIAVVGSHGKTTTTSLIGTLMHKMGLDPTVIIGGIVDHFGSNAFMGKSQFMVIEADESDGTYLHLSPTIAVVTNIDAEHLDYYDGEIKQLKEKITYFINNLPFYGLAVLCVDDNNIQDILPYINRRVMTYGFSDKAYIRATNVIANEFKTSFDVLVAGEKRASVELPMIGQHNVLNCLAAMSVLIELGVKLEYLLSILSTYNGVQRRFTKVSHSRNFLVVDDYAHHPTEIKAVLLATKKAFPHKKLRVIFQPHRYSRTRDLAQEFGTSFLGSDSLIITEIYGAGEKPLPGINAQTIINSIKHNTAMDPIYAMSVESGVDRIVNITEKNDIVLVMGAGSITEAALTINETLTAKLGL